MDFISFAQSTSFKAVRRYLQEDDDFSQLDTTHASHTSDSILDMTKEAAALSTNDDNLENAPMLSPSAEAELYLLATNFLLYVAMILIITMICKIYFPEALERNSSDEDGVPGTRTSLYRRVSDEEYERGSNYYSSDEDAEGGNKEGNKEGKKGETTNRPIMQSILEGSKGTTSYPDLLEFEQKNTSKSGVLRRLAFCVIMLNVTFVTWGVLQERMLTRRYPRFTGEFFTYSYALVFTSRFWTLIMSGFLMLYLKPRTSSSTIIYEYSFPSISNMLSSWCQYEALRYVSFPAVTLFKSFKLAPVMAMGKFLGNKQYPQYDYWVAFCIGIGITMFMTSTDDLQVGFGYNIYAQEASATWTGIMLLGLFLFFDSFTSQWQSRMFQRHRDLSMVELMFATSAFSSLLSLITLIHSDELTPALDFVYRHSEIHLHFFLFSICATIGQLLIFYTIKNFGAVVFTIIMTTRVLMSIALSVYMYGHNVTEVGFFGLVLVMSAVCYRVKRKAEGSQLIKWRGMDDTNAPSLVQEWHEHVDM
jgi:adenosine 3'-phospho 5'-phosphosulfate transporter B2